MAGELVHYKELKEAVRELDAVRHALKEIIHIDRKIDKKIGHLVHRMKKPCMVLWSR